MLPVHLHKDWLSGVLATQQDSHKLPLRSVVCL